VPLFRGRLSRLFRTRSGAREEDVVSALRDLEETLRQVEDRLKDELLRADRVEAGRPVVPAPVQEEAAEGPGPDSQAAPDAAEAAAPTAPAAPVEQVEPETIEAVEPVETVPPAEGAIVPVAVVPAAVSKAQPDGASRMTVLPVAFGKSVFTCSAITIDRFADHAGALPFAAVSAFVV